MADHQHHCTTESVDLFTTIADRWWDSRGPMRILHQLTTVRIQLVLDTLERTTPPNGKSGNALEGIRAVDVGCGGGLMSEPLARLGARVIGLDSSSALVAVAQQHAADHDLSHLTTYHTGQAEHTHALVDNAHIALCLELLEHVPRPAMVIQSLAQSIRPGGFVILSTINRTLASRVLAIGVAELLLRWIPPNTHDWNQFLKPSEVARMCRASGLHVTRIVGLVYRPTPPYWFLGSSLSVNYALVARKTLPGSTSPRTPMDRKN